MYNSEFDDMEIEENEEVVEYEDIDKSFEESLKYHAVPLDKQMTLDEDGIPFTLQELMELKELKEELD